MALVCIYKSDVESNPGVKFLFRIKNGIRC